MPILGKMSVGVRMAASGPKIRIIRAMTMNVYGRSSATFTSQVMGRAFLEKCRALPFGQVFLMDCQDYSGKRAPRTDRVVASCRIVGAARLRTASQRGAEALYSIGSIGY